MAPSQIGVKVGCDDGLREKKGEIESTGEAQNIAHKRAAQL